MRTSPPAVQADPVAQVSCVQVFPVKGAGAGAPRMVRLDADGVIGDRRYVVVDGVGSVLSAQREPRLREVVAWLDEAGEPCLDIPGLDPGLRGAAADAALTALLVQPVRVQAVPAGAQLDAPVHLVSLQSVEAARRGEHQAAECACSLEEPRANIVVDLVPDAAGLPVREEAWEGRLLRLGRALVRVQRRPEHCLGIYAEVLAPGEVQAGDQVFLVEDTQDSAPATAVVSSGAQLLDVAEAGDEALISSDLAPTGLGWPGR